MKKSNNKGFSLVELIVVVAIMAVLVGVLAPAYLKYVENSRIQKDESAASEVVRAVEIALAEEDNYTSVTSPAKITITDKPASGDATWTPSGLTAVDSKYSLIEDVQATVGKTIDLTSKKYDGGTIVVDITITDGVVTVTGGAVAKTTTP